MAAIAPARKDSEHNRRPTADSSILASRNPQDLIQDASLDVIDIVTPYRGHAKLILDAARAGKQAICEWPLTDGLAEAEFISDSIIDSFCAMGLQARFSPALTVSREWIRNQPVTTSLTMDLFHSGPFGRRSGSSDLVRDFVLI